MKSLISDSSRAEYEKKSKHHSHATAKNATRKKLVITVGACIGLVLVAVLAYQFLSGEEAVKVTPEQVQHADKIASNIRELEAADKRIAPAMPQTPPADPERAGQPQPESLRTRKKP